MNSNTLELVNTVKKKNLLILKDRCVTPVTEGIYGNLRKESAKDAGD